MADSRSLIYPLFSTVKEAFSYHQKRLKELQFKNYTFLESEELVELLLQIDTQILRHLGKIENDILKGRTQEPLEQTMVRITRLGLLSYKFHSIFQVLETGSREYIPQGSIVIIRDVAANFPKSKFILLPLYRYNYSYQELMKPLKDALKDVLPDINKKLDLFAENFAIVGFPLMEKENVLLNSLLGHELGHFIDLQKQISHKLLSKVWIDPKVVERIARSLSTRKLSTEKNHGATLDHFISYEMLKANIADLTSKTIEKWLGELVADLIAFHMLGPIFLFELKNFLLTMKGIDDSSDKYPPPRMRIKMLIEEFSKMKYETELKQHEMGKDFVEVVNGLRKQLQEIEEKERDEIEDLVFRSITKVIPDLRENVREATAKLDYNPKRFCAEVFPLVGILDSFVTPVEVSPGSPASPVSILNCGLLYELLSMDRLYKMLNAKGSAAKLNAKHKLHQLLLKALELSDIQSSWKMAKGS